MTKLKRCPFCGGEARLVTRRQEGTSIEPKHFIMCERCRCMTSESWILKVVIDKWNTRTPEIVRCGECEHFDGSEIAGRCALTTPENLEDNEVYWEIADFCSYGERREENAKKK